MLAAILMAWLQTISLVYRDPLMDTSQLRVEIILRIRKQLRLMAVRQFTCELPALMTSAWFCDAS